MALTQFSATGLTSTLVLAFFVWRLYLVIYRFYYHPLAAFPGPWLARCSFMYEYYYDLWLPGQFTWKLKELHKRYGPIVRINPDELHINDPNYYDEVYNNTNGIVEKPAKAALVFGPYPAAIGTTGHDLHRIRRSALNPFFSRRSVMELMPFLNTIIQDLAKRFEKAAALGQTVNLKYAYNALTMDNITEYCFSMRSDRVLLPDFDRQTLDNIESFASFSHMNMHLPWLMAPLYRIPDSLLRIIAPKMADSIDLRESLSQQIEDIRSGRDRSYEKRGHRTIFHDLLSEESNLPPAEKEKSRIRDEAFSVVAAGSVTTAQIMTTITYHLMVDPIRRERLVAELKTIMPARDMIPSLTEIEKLPYLTAVIHEGLRMAHAVTHRFIRRFPQKALECHGKIIPPGTPVSMTSILLHENEDVFPQPHEFRPERWLSSSSSDGSKGPVRYLVPFSRGTRGCLGLTLAWAELYVVLAIILRRFEFDVSLVERARDIDITRDMIIGVPAPESQGVVVYVKPIA